MDFSIITDNIGIYIDGFFITDARYAYEATQNILDKNIEVIENRDLIKTLKRIIKKTKIKKL